MSKHTVIVSHWLPEGEFARWQREFTSIDFVDAKTPDALDRADIAYGLPDLARLPNAGNLRWIQLASAGVPAALCGIAKQKQIQVTNLAGLYGPTIAEHALAMLLILNRNLQVVQRNQASKNWDRTVADTMRDLHGKTLAIVGVGNIGTNIARLAKAFGMRVVGCRNGRLFLPLSPYGRGAGGEGVAHVDQIYPSTELRAMFADADHIAIAAPLTSLTEGMVGLEALQAAKPRAILVNVSRGPIVQEKALIEVLRNGPLGGAGLDVFAVEPLATDHPLWTMPNVVVSPHYSGETVNTGLLPAQRFLRNLRAFLGGKLQEGVVDLEQGY